MRTAHYRCYLAKLTGNYRVVADDFDRRRPISSGISEGGRRRGEPGGFFARSLCDPSPAGDFFSPRWEKKHLPTWRRIKVTGMPYAYRSVPGTLPYRGELVMLVRTEDEQFEADKAQVVKEIQALKKENTL
ncbi:hypothetical protein BHM03_00037313 [Ensete ventricosum]|nr:hypothetical protein BHM03_00037313 [Ensete ventricosum]